MFVVQALLVDTAPEIVGLPLHHFMDRDEQGQIANPRFPGRLAEPSGLEGVLKARGEGAFGVSSCSTQSYRRHAA